MKIPWHVAPLNFGPDRIGLQAIIHTPEESSSLYLTPMSATTLLLTVEPGALDARSSWSEFKSFVVTMTRDVPLQALEATLADAQERLIDSVRGPRCAPVPGLPAPFGCPGCEMAEDFARKVSGHARAGAIKTGLGV